MDVVILLGILVLGPIIVVGAIQILVWKLLGSRILRWVSALVSAACFAYLMSELFAPPVYGNKSALIGLGTVGIVLLLIENLAILITQQLRRFLASEDSAVFAPTSMPTRQQD